MIRRDRLLERQTCENAIVMFWQEMTVWKDDSGARNKGNKSIPVAQVRYY